MLFIQVRVRVLYKSCSEEPLSNFKDLPVLAGPPITVPSMSTHVGSTAIRSRISSVEGPCSHLAAHLACVIMNLFGCV